MLHQSLLQMFFLPSHSNYKIAINSKISYITLTTCLSNSSCVSCYLSTTSFMYLSFTSFYNLLFSTFFCVFLALAIMLFSFMLQNTLQTQNANTLLKNLNNKKKFNGHSYFSFFVLGQPTIFVLDRHFLKHPIQFTMTSLLYIHVETIDILFTYQWSKCIVPFFIHPCIIVATCLVIPHIFYHVY
jgi:phage-related holin